MRLITYLNEALKYKVGRFDGMYTPVKFEHGTLFFRKRSYRGINDGNEIYEIHFGVEEAHRGQGYAGEMIKSFLRGEKATAWLAFGRIANTTVHRVMEKLGKEPGWSVEKLKDGYLIHEA